MAPPTSRFVQIHTLHPYSASLPNRDSQGRAKRITVGGVPRLRIASQARKYAIRTNQGLHAIKDIEGVSPSLRSRSLIELRVTQPLRMKDNADEEKIDAIESRMNVGVYGPRANEPAARQVIMLGLAEIEWLTAAALRIYEISDGPSEARERTDALFAARTGGSNIRAFRENTRLAAGIDTAVFGRMITADRTASVRSPLTFGHSFGVSETQTEIDYFQVMDDLATQPAGAAAYAGETELTTAIYYGYICIDTPTLVSNLEGVEPRLWLSADRTLAAEITRRLIMLAATAQTGAMRSQTAPHSYASVLLIEIGESQPRQLSGAFIEPCAPVPRAAAERLFAHLEDMDQTYGQEERRRLASVENVPCPGAARVSAAAAAEWAAESVLRGAVER